MSDRRRPRLRWLIRASAFGLLLLLLTSCERKILTLTSSISPEPIVGQTVSYHVELSATGTPVPNVTLTITLPSGIELIQGDLSWHGDLTKDEKIVKDLTIRVTTPGEWIVKAYADTDMGPGAGRTYLSFTQALYITSSTNSAEVVDALKKTPTPCGPDIGCGTPLKPITHTVTPHEP
jgi:uncharacterized repeat protein (TIGR01451 family)